MDKKTSMVIKSRGDRLVARKSINETPANFEVRLRTKACALNYADILQIRGEYQEKIAPPFVPGMEICGVVEGLGASVDGLTVGTRVICVPGHGGLATHINVPASLCIPVPDGISDVEAAGFQISYGTSDLALIRRARLKEGETVVVLGAAGGVGLTAVEIAHLSGARVIGVARGAQKLEIARAAGADVILDSDDGDLKARLKALAPVHVVYDAVGGTMGEAALSALAPEGRYLVIGFASGEIPKLRPNHLLVKNIDVIGFYWGGYTKFDHKALRNSLSKLLDWAVAGRIKPHVSHVLPLERAEEGLDLLRNRRATGKIVITP